MTDIVIALDSFKGTCSAFDAVAAVSRGWVRQRPHDTIHAIPFADGGEGTLDLYRTLVPSALIHTVADVDGPPIEWLDLGNNHAVIELARVCGLAYTGTHDPEGASTWRLGLALRDAILAGATEITIALGGSGSTDGGAGILAGVGARLLDSGGRPVADGNIGLADATSVDWTDSIVNDAHTITILTDVTNPLLGVRGSAHVFGPQKGASASQVQSMDKRLGSFARLFPDIDPTTPGSGAAGGAAFGLRALGGTIRAGAETVAAMLGIPDLIASADLVILGEGRFDSQSLNGKAVGVLAEIARTSETTAWLIAGTAESGERYFAQVRTLATLAPSLDSAMAEPERWLEQAGHELACIFDAADEQSTRV